MRVNKRIRYNKW